MGDVHSRVKLKVVRESEEPAPVQNTDAVKPKMKSAMASQLSSWADELDKQIAQILAS
ncbi:MAG: hypothetical protein V4655_09525 [Bdellovibrionota bacterium]